MAVRVYRSTDANAPTLAGLQGQLNILLRACLVNGYGTAATGTLTHDGTNPADGDTVTVGLTTSGAYTAIIYRFKNTLAAAYDVKIGANADATLANLVKAINFTGVAGTDYGTNTTKHLQVSAGTVASSATVITAIQPWTGAVGNTITTTRSSAHLSWGASTLTGGSTTSAGAGWTAVDHTTVYSLYNYVAYVMGSGIGHGYGVFDDVTLAAVGREAYLRGYETFASWASVGPQYPSAAQYTTIQPVIRKSTSADATVRAWTIIADDRTVYGFAATMDATLIATDRMTFGFGEFYSLLSGDVGRGFVAGRVNNSISLNNSNDELFGLVSSIGSRSPSGTANLFAIARSYTGLGGSLVTGNRFADYVRSNNSANVGALGMGTPTGIDGAVHISPIHVGESAAAAVRGRMRGFFSPCHPGAAFTDGDTITGAGAYAGRTFLVVKTGGCAFTFDITGPWETN